MDNEKINILLVDDHELILNGLKTLLEQEPDFNIVAIAKNGLEAKGLLQHLKVDIVITDIKMPEMNGLQLAEIIKKQSPSIKVLVLSLYQDIEFVKTIIETEAEGYLLKNIEQKELVFAIRHIANDGTYYSKEIVSILKKEFKDDNKKKLTSHNLSNREIEIVRLICEEYSSIEIAEKLFISKATVDVHRKNILQKVEVKNIVGLIKFALQNQIINEL